MLVLKVAMAMVSIVGIRATNIMEADYLNQSKGIVTMSRKMGLRLGTTTEEVSSGSGF